MHKSVMVAALVALSSSAYASEDSHLLMGKQLHDAISGKTVYIQTPLGSEIPIRYNPNGVMTGVTATHLAALAGEEVNADKGRWWIRRAELCQQWNKWSNGRAHCYKLRTSGQTVYWTRNDGESGTARLGH
jgi:hypothetical protein